MQFANPPLTAYRRDQSTRSTTFWSHDVTRLHNLLHSSHGMTMTRSSPPLADADIPSSPPLIPQLYVPRKRRFDDNLSSDPLFSEDLPETDDHPIRRKRLYRGPWWMHVQDTTSDGRKMTRFADSGVWLASESSEDSLPNHTTTSETQPAKSISTPHDEAAQRISDCIDNNNERIDLE